MFLVGVKATQIGVKNIDIIIKNIIYILYSKQHLLLNLKVTVHLHSSSESKSTPIPSI
jgi:hypothetical protein